MIKNSLISYSILILVLSCNDKPIDKSFPDLEFESVIAYKMKGKEQNVVENNQISNNVESKSRILNGNQTNSLISILNKKSTFGGTPAKCFEPHLGFVFYNKGKEIVAHSTICLACNWMTTTPKIKEFAFSERGANRMINLEKEIFSE